MHVSVCTSRAFTRARDSTIVNCSELRSQFGPSGRRESNRWDSIEGNAQLLVRNVEKNSPRHSGCDDAVLNAVAEKEEGKKGRQED